MPPKSAKAEFVARDTAHPGIPKMPRRLWWGIGICLILAAVSFPTDSWVAGLFGPDGFTLIGDPRRELEALQQFGQLAVTLLAAWIIWQLDPMRRRLLLDLLLAKIVLGLLVLGSKALVGRARPSVGDASLFAGPLGRVPVHPGGEPVGVWSASDGLNPALAAMPSGHMAHAALLAVALGMWYPRLIPVVATLAGIVGVARVMTGAHYPSDVFVGAALGLLVGGWIVSGYRGVRLLDAIWVRFIDRQASPAFLELQIRLENQSAAQAET